MGERKIIRIDESKCNGCGNCVTDCHEGALAIIDGKAKLVREDFCDGLGDCIKGCPTGALTIEAKGTPCGCPGSAMRFSAPSAGGNRAGSGKQKGELNPQKVELRTQNEGVQVIRSEISHWPLQLHLVNPSAPYFADRELVVLSTCSPVSDPDINWKLIRGRAVVIACPKLDATEPYAEKLADIFATANTPKVHVVMMEVPCCKGLRHLVDEAVKLSGRTDLAVEEHIIKIPL